MNMSQNAKTQENTRRHDDCIFPNPPKGLGGIEVAGEINGTYTNRLNSGDSSKENLSQSFDEGNSSAGKILTRLKTLESDYLSFISEQEQRLEAQLEEVKRRNANFRQSVREIEQDIQDLMSGDE